jgi:hypothetical protein
MSFLGQSVSLCFPSGHSRQRGLRLRYIELPTIASLFLLALAARSFGQEAYTFQQESFAANAQLVAPTNSPVASISPAEYTSPWNDLANRNFDQPGPSLTEMQKSPGCIPSPMAGRPNVAEECQCENGDDWHWYMFPTGLIYQSYMAGTKEPRFASFWNQNNKMGDMWDVALGGRWGLFRYGNDDPNWPQGWQLDVEGGVFPRLDPQADSTPLIGDDFRVGIPLTYGINQWQFKLGYYHISAHLGDEWVLLHPGIDRINYVRDGIIFGCGYFFTPAFRLYGEVGAAAASGGAEPMEFQFGFEWAQAHDTGFRGGPFVAANADLRQEVDYDGTYSVQWGWMWRRFVRGPDFRIGGQYITGKSDEYEFFKRSESRLGWGIWYDF